MVANQTYTIRWNNGRDLDLGQDGEQEKWASAMKNREYIHSHRSICRRHPVLGGKHKPQDDLETLPRR